MDARTYEHTIIVCSDSTGETAEAVVKATMRQFDVIRASMKRYSQIANEDEVRVIVEEAARIGAYIAYTLVQPELREMMKQESIRLGVRTVDIMGPMMQAYVDTFNGNPLAKPGLLHRLDADYFRRIEAVEFAVRYDDGKDPAGLLQAEIVLIGVSRTSKTPLSIFLAHKGLKVSNLPLIPELKVPAELSQIRKDKIFGLKMGVDHMLRVRMERLRAMGLNANAQYAQRERILEELDYAEAVMASVGCKVIDVSDRAIEETAGLIVEHIYG